MSSLRMVSPITDVYWAGWKSNTLSLQKAGWQMAIKDLPHLSKCQFAFTHPEYKLWGLSEPLNMMDVPRILVSNRQFSNQQYFPPIVIYAMASDLRIEVSSFNNDHEFEPIDATPSIIKVENISMADMNIFRTIGNSREIFIPEQDSVSLLNKILELQAPHQKELREKKRQNYQKFQKEIDNLTKEVVKQYDNRKDIIAQIITV